MKKYVWAIGSCVGIYCLFLILEINFWYSPYRTFGWVFRQLLVFSAMAAVWRKITKKKSGTIKNQSSANSPKVPEKSPSLTAHEPMQTSQAPDEAVYKPNACPICGAENSPDVKFCETCGENFYRACPECGRENSVKKHYCGGCGTDIPGFLATEAVLNRIEACVEEGNLLQIIKEGLGYKDDIRLPGPKGTNLRDRIKEIAWKADNILKQIEMLEKEVELLRLGGEKPSISDDRKLLELLRENYRIQPYLPEKIRMLEKEAKARAEEAARVVRRRNFKIIAGFVVVVVLGSNKDTLLFNIRKNAFQKAIETRQLEAAQIAASKLDGFYDTSAELKALKEFYAAKDQFNKDAVIIRGLFKKFSDSEWAAVQELVSQAEEPGSPRAGAMFYEQARAKLQAVSGRTSN